jgi:hypothetical protein
LTYVPLARDAVSFGWASNGVTTPVTTLTQQQINAIYTATTIPVVINGVDVYPCGIQSGSGTANFWLGVTGANSSQEIAATAACNALAGSTLSGGRIEENNMTTLQTKANNLPAGSQVIAGFSAGSFVSQANGAAPSSLPATTTYGLGSISDNGSGTSLGAPFTGTAPALAPSSTFYSDTKFGRDIYYVLDSAKVNAAGNNFLAIKNMFLSTPAGVTVPGLAAGHVAEICTPAAQATANKFGFLSHTSLAGGANTCGNPTLKKGSLANNL